MLFRPRQRNYFSPGSKVEPGLKAHTKASLSTCVSCMSVVILAGEGRWMGMEKTTWGGSRGVVGGGSGDGSVVVAGGGSGGTSSMGGRRGSLGPTLTMVEIRSM
jgi:hypothetical protein